VFGYGNAGPLKVNDTWYEFSQNVEERPITFKLMYYRSECTS